MSVETKMKPKQATAKQRAERDSDRGPVWFGWRRAGQPGCRAVHAEKGWRCERKRGHEHDHSCDQGSWPQRAEEKSSAKK